jgi:hypothetical protein
MGALCIADDKLSTPSTTSAEISGWDADGRFFVETAEIETAESGDISAQLRRRITDGSLVFFRSVGPGGGEDTVRGLPIAHEVLGTNTPDDSGQYHVRFTTCRPRAVHYGDRKFTSRI